MEFTVGQIKPVECFQEGWDLIKDRYWLFLGITLVGMLIAGLIPLGFGIGAMFCGIYYCLLQKINRQPVGFEMLFKGFDFFLPGLIVTLILIIPNIISAIILVASTITMLFSLTDSHGGLNETAIFALYGTVFTEGVIVALILSCLHALIMFAFPLIVEHRLSGVEAFKLSAKAVWKNLPGVIGLIICEFVIGIIGYLALFVGVYFTLPIMFAGVFVAYRKVFPAAPNYNSPPAPPQFNQGGWQS